MSTKHPLCFQPKFTDDKKNFSENYGRFSITKGGIICLKLIDIHRDQGKQTSVAAQSNRRNASV